MGMCCSEPSLCLLTQIGALHCDSQLELAMLEKNVHASKQASDSFLLLQSRGPLTMRICFWRRDIPAHGRGEDYIKPK